jgi:hypothetical protein
VPRHLTSRVPRHLTSRVPRHLTSRVPANLELQVSVLLPVKGVHSTTIDNWHHQVHHTVPVFMNTLFSHANVYAACLPVFVPLRPCMVRIKAIFECIPFILSSP